MPDLWKDQPGFPDIFYGSECVSELFCGSRKTSSGARGHGGGRGDQYGIGLSLYRDSGLGNRRRSGGDSCRGDRGGDRSADLFFQKKYESSPIDKDKDKREDPVKSLHQRFF